MLTAAELAEWRADVAVTFWDTCVVQTYTVGTPDAHGQAVITWVDGSAIACGFRFNTPRMIQGAPDVPVRISEATVRLPLGTTIATGDRIKITKRQDAMLTTALVFEIIGHSRPGPSCLVLDLERSS